MIPIPPPDATATTPPSTLSPADIPPVPRQFHKKNSIILLVLVLLLGVGMVVSILSLGKSQDTRSRATVTGPKLTLSPAMKSAGIGETYSLGLIMNTDTATVSAAEIHLSYDPSVIQVVSFTPSAVMPIVLVPETPSNDGVTVTIGVQPTKPFNGNDIVGSWTIKVLAAKQSKISFTTETKVAAFGTSRNALVSATGATITGTSDKPAATPTAGSTPTNKPTTAPTVTATPTPKGTTILTSKPTVKPTAAPTAGSTPTPVPTSPPPPGCFYKQVTCFAPPCAPILTCPSPTITPTSAVHPTEPSPQEHHPWWWDIWNRLKSLVERK